MMWSLGFIALFCTAVSSKTTIDLTHKIEPGLAQWPGQTKFTVEITSPPDAVWSSRSFCTEEHTGTHLDAPFHFNRKGLKVHQIPLEKLIGPAVVVDIQERVKDDPNAKVLLDDLKEWETKYGQITAGSIVLMRSGWASRWSNPTEYLGDVNNATRLTFPGFSKEAAELMVARGVSGAGVDTASLDPGNSTDFAAHFTLLNNNLYGLENVANMEKLPAKGATIYIMPILIKDGSGAPARVFAIVEDVHA